VDRRMRDGAYPLSGTAGEGGSVKPSELKQSKASSTHEREV
jgi:hypothetical protein